MIFISLFFYIIFFCLSLLVVLFFSAQLVAVFTTHAPFVPVPMTVRKQIVNQLNLKDDSVLYDLGCGDACILSEATLRHPNLKSIGVEIALFPYLLAKLKTRKQKNIIIKREDIFKTNLKDATHIFLYLYPEVINKLIINIKNQCRPGTIIISCDFELNDTQPTRTVKLENSNPDSTRGKKLFIYKI